MENTNEEKARKFLDYIANNMQRLRKALKKNITYDTDLFEDAMQDSIIKIYNSILKNGTDIKDYEQYFFIVSKFTYIYFDNKKKKNDAIEIRDLFDNGKFDMYDEEEGLMEERFEGALNAIDLIRKNLTDTFGEEKANVYMTYMERKTNGRTSYKEMSKDFKISVRDISAIINEIKCYLSDSDEINKIKKQYREI